MRRPSVKRPFLSELLRRSRERVAAMTPQERAEMHEAQRQSWLRGDLGMGSDADEARDRAAYRKGTPK